jgi:hypothetical protein
MGAPGPGAPGSVYYDPSVQQTTFQAQQPSYSG